MVNTNIKLVAIHTNENGKCDYISICKNVNDRELAQYQLQEQECRIEELKKINELHSCISLLEKEVVELKKEIAILKGEDYEESN